MKTVRSGILTAGFAGAIALCAATPGIAAPAMTSTNIVKSSAPTATQVRWRGGGALAAGAIAGFAAGAIAAATAAPYYGGDPYYDYYPAPGPFYAGPGQAYPQTYNYYRGGYGGYYRSGYGGYYRSHGGRDPAGCGPGTPIC